MNVRYFPNIGATFALLFFLCFSWGCPGPSKVKEVEPSDDAHKVCLPSGEDQQILALSNSDDVLGFCIMAENESCWELDLKNGQWAALAINPHRVQNWPQFMQHEGVVEVCTSEDTCVNVTLSEETLPYGGLRYALNGDGTRLAVTVSDDASFFTVYDVTSDTVLYRSPFDDYPDQFCADPQWLDDVLCLHTNVCAGPGGRSLLVEGGTGKRLGCVGCDNSINTYGEPAIKLRGDDWVFADAFGASLQVVNVRTVEVKVNIDLLKQLGEESHALSENSNYVFTLSGEKFGVLLGGILAGDVLLFDANGQLLEHYKASRCVQQPTEPQ